MRPFLDSNRGHGLEGDSNLRSKTTNSYIELEYAADGQFLVTYIIPVNDHTIIVATCWEHYFDGIEQYLGDDSSVRTFTETWPLAAQLLANGMNGQYSEGALIRSADLDTADQKWFLCTCVGNLNPENMEWLFCERIRDAERLVISLSVQLFNEVTTRQPNQFAHYGRKILSGFGRFANIAAVIGISLLFGEDGDAGYMS